MTGSPLQSDLVLQICFVTDNLDRSVEWFSHLTGAPVPRINQTAPGGGEMSFHGEARKAAFRQILFDLGNIAVEFFEPGPEPSTWRDFLERKGRGVHHIAFKTRNLRREGGAFVAHGLGEVQRGEFEGGGGRYAYYDSEDELGCLIELLEFDSDRDPND